MEQIKKNEEIVVKREHSKYSSTLTVKVGEQVYPITFYSYDAVDIIAASGKEVETLIATGLFSIEELKMEFLLKARDFRAQEIEEANKKKVQLYESYTKDITFVQFKKYLEQYEKIKFDVVSQEEFFSGKEFGVKVFYESFNCFISPSIEKWGERNFVCSVGYNLSEEMKTVKCKTLEGLKKFIGRFVDCSDAVIKRKASKEKEKENKATKVEVLAVIFNRKVSVENKTLPSYGRGRSRYYFHEEVRIQLKNTYQVIDLSDDGKKVHCFGAWYEIGALKEIFDAIDREGTK